MGKSSVTVNTQMNRKATKQEFKANKKLAAERDGHKCKLCGATYPLECHHIIPFRRSLDNSVNNLVTLCHDCHAKVDGNVPKPKTES
jgi:5-methylcytosine-specific restriction endonuclease McrA